MLHLLSFLYWVEKPYYVLSIISVVGLVYVIGTVAHDRTNLEPFYDDLCVSGVQHDIDLCTEWTDRIIPLICKFSILDPRYGYCILQLQSSNYSIIMNMLEDDFSVIYKLVIFMTSYLLAFFVVSTVISIAFYFIFSPSGKDAYGNIGGEYSESSSLLAGGKICDTSTV